MAWGERLGRLEFLRGRGDPIVEMARRWFMVAMGASATGRFVFDLTREWSAALLVLIPLVGEGATVLIGVLMARWGIVRAMYGTARDLDPYKSESLALLGEIRDLLSQQTVRAGDRLVLVDRSVRIVRIEPRPGGAKAIFAQRAE